MKKLIINTFAFLPLLSSAMELRDDALEDARIFAYLVLGPRASSLKSESAALMDSLLFACCPGSNEDKLSGKTKKRYTSSPTPLAHLFTPPEGSKVGTAKIAETAEPTPSSESKMTAAGDTVIIDFSDEEVKKAAKDWRELPKEKRRKAHKRNREFLDSKKPKKKKRSALTKIKRLSHASSKGT